MQVACAQTLHLPAATATTAIQWAVIRKSVSKQVSEYECDMQSVRSWRAVGAWSHDTQWESKRGAVQRRMMEEDTARLHM